MRKIVHRAEGRGNGDYGWLKTRYSFSFADWHDESRMGFGALRVLNDDEIAPSSGFPTHGHRNMEIVTIVTQGTLTHKDSLGNTGTIRAGEVQAMSAGTGVMHSEWNASPDEPLALFQIWIETATPESYPRYAQKAFPALTVEEGIRTLVGPDGASDLPIGQDAFISRAVLDADHPLSYEMRRKGHGLYVFVVEGSIEVAGETLIERDALALTGETRVEIRAEKEADILLIEVPVGAD